MSLTIQRDCEPCPQGHRERWVLPPHKCVQCERDKKKRQRDRARRAKMIRLLCEDLL